MGSLHIDPDDEPRRGASRANSVRFDESALHGQFGAASRSSTEFLPLRTGSAFGSHAMTERSSSHKSEGRQSSTHSARASSFGIESRPLSATVPPFIPLGPPPGLFILGPVPSIIRCWLNTQFTNESLLYAAVSTASYKSALDIDLISRLGYEDQITTDNHGQRTIKIPVYLPEATIQTVSSRSSSPAPSLPTITTTFVVQNSHSKTKVIQVFLGCDVLRSRNADIHFSLDRLTLFDDDRNKLSVPLVRPEDSAIFQNLRTVGTAESSVESSIADLSGQEVENVKTNGATVRSEQGQASKKSEIEGSNNHTTEIILPASNVNLPSVIGESKRTIVDLGIDESSQIRTNNDLKESENSANGISPDTPTRSDGGNIWGSWRRDSTQNSRGDSSVSNVLPTSGYQRAGRGRGMKVLRPTRVNTSRSTSAQQPVGFDSTPLRFGETSRNSNQGGANSDDQSPSGILDRRPFGMEAAKLPPQPLSNKPRSSNPIGGASAFGWLNSGQQKTPSNAD